MSGKQFFARKLKKKRLETEKSPLKVAEEIQDNNEKNDQFKEDFKFLNINKKNVFDFDWLNKKKICECCKCEICENQNNDFEK